MLTRRDFLKWSSVATLVAACGKDVVSPGTAEELSRRFAAEQGQTVLLYDTYAMALYMDGTLGPKTGIVKVEYVLANVPVPMEFWHGHGGKNHQYTLLPSHFAEMKQLKKVTLQTTVVESHSHKLFVDMSDARWRVPGAKPIPVPLLR